MLEAQQLTRRYGALTAVDGVSFTVRPGEVLGFLGPNGAGKTTTMRMIAGFVQPTAGRALVHGHCMQEEPLAAKRLIGYLPEGAPCYAEMTPRTFLGFIAGIRGLEGTRRQARLDDVIGRLQLAGVLDQPIETLSKGFRRRVGLAQAILHDPPVLILDEPTDGLDPNQKHEVRELIRTMSPGKIIIISTHILEEVDAVCSRAIIIARGRIVADEEPAALVRRSRHHNAVTLTLEASGNLHGVAAAIRALDGVGHIEVDEAGHALTAFPCEGAPILAAISHLAAEQYWPLGQLHLESGRLDEVFRHITRQEAA